MNLFENIYIPQEYIYNDVDTRMNLLAGFIDKNGKFKKYNGNISYEILQSNRLNEQLIEQISYIAHTLGYYTKICFKDTRLKSVIIYGNGLEKFQ